MNIKHLFLFLFFGSLLPVFIMAQPGTTTEEAVQLEAIFIEGNREKLLGNYEKAVEYFQQVLEKSPQNPAVNYELARVYDALDQDENALRAIKTAAETAGDNMWYQMFLADVYHKMDKNAEAAEVYADLIDKYPDLEYHYFKYAFFLVKAKEYKNALKVYDRMEKQFGINEDLTRRKHTLFVGMGDNKKAAEELENLIAKFPNDTDYLHLLAGFYQQIGQTADAKEVYTRILRLDPTDGKAQLALAGNLQNNDDLSYLQSLQAVFQNSSESIDVKVKALFPYIMKVAETKDPQLIQATTDLAETLCQVHPNDAKAFSIKGDLLYHAGQPAAALQAYQRTTDLDNSVFSVWEQMLHIYHETHDTDALVTTSEKVMDLFPNQAKAYYLHALGQMDKEQYMPAIAALQQASMMSRRNPDLHLDIVTKMVLAYAAADKLEAAQKQLEKALSMRSDHYLVHDAQGYLWAKQGNLKEAKAQYEKAIADETGNKNPMILEHFGDLHYQLGNAEKAVQFWKKAQTNGGGGDRLLRKIAEEGM